jgi:ribosomal protein S18 acetylase RimI-like enzyme
VSHLALPDGLTSRPLRADDMDAAADLLAAAERVDDTGEHQSAEDLRQWWVNDLVDLERDSRAHNAAFTDHYGSSERDPGSWQLMFTGQRNFRPDLSVLAIEDGAVVGYVLAYVHEANTEATGERETYLGQIGVLPPVRGRGISTAVIAQALRAAAEHDCQVAALQVDSGNSSGAGRLHERPGFSTERTDVSWVRQLPALR